MCFDMCMLSHFISSVVVSVTEQRLRLDSQNWRYINHVIIIMFDLKIQHCTLHMHYVVDGIYFFCYRDHLIIHEYVILNTFLCI